MCRALVFAFRDALDAFVAGKNEKKSVPFSYAAAARSVTREVAFDLPCALFLTTYALLVLFWAEIYRQARPGARDRDRDPRRAPRRVFFFGNLALYVVLAAFWAAGGVAAGRANFMTDSNRGSEGAHSRTRRILEACAAGALALCACVLAAFFAKYGGSLFFTLRRFPARLKGRRKKLREVGTVTAVCALCFSARAAVVAAEAVALGRRGGKGGFLDAAHPAAPAADVAYYAACELLPAATALVVLRKLPPKQQGAARAESADRGDENV